MAQLRRKYGGEESRREALGDIQSALAEGGAIPKAILGATEPYCQWLDATDDADILSAFKALEFGEVTQ